MFTLSQSLINIGARRLFSTGALSAGEKLLDNVFRGLQCMKPLNDPFIITKTSDTVVINKSTEKEFSISLLQNGNVRLVTPENHYNDYHYVEESDAFENKEDGHNLLDAFVRDILSHYNGCPDICNVCSLSKQANVHVCDQHTFYLKGHLPRPRKHSHSYQ